MSRDWRWWTEVTTWLRAGGYRRASFVVDRAIYHDDEPARDNQTKAVSTPGAPRWWAEGKIDGQEETLGLAGFLDRIPGGQEDLDRLVPAGRTFDVLYNPSLSKVIVQGTTPRAIPYMEDFSNMSARRVRGLVFLSDSPLGALLALAFLLRRVFASTDPGARSWGTTPLRGVWALIGLQVVALAGIALVVRFSSP